MNNEIIFYIEESPEGGYEANAPGFSIFTEGDDINELKHNIREAVHCHFDTGWTWEAVYTSLTAQPTTRPNNT